MGSKKINRDVKTKADDDRLNALGRAGQWLQDNIFYTPDKIKEINSAYQANYGENANTESTSPKGDINKGWTTAGVQYYPDGTPYDSPGKGYSMDQYGRPIPHNWQSEGTTIKPFTPSETTEIQTPVPPADTAASEPITTPETALPAISLAKSWADQREIPVIDSQSFVNPGTAKEPTVDTNTYGSKMTGPDGEEMPIEAETWSEETNSMVDAKTDWSKAKARASSASAFLNAPAGSGALGPLAARDAAVGVSRGVDKDGNFLNYKRDGKTYQIRGSQDDMATAAYKAAGGDNIFGEYDFKELPQSAE